MVHESDLVFDKDFGYTDSDLDEDGHVGIEERKRWKRLKKLAAQHRKRLKRNAEGWVDDRPNVEISLPDGDASLVEFKYSQPNISVDKKVRYAEHKVLGGTTVRQRLGEDPPQISIEGVCTVREANSIDYLSATQKVELISHRWEGQAEVASSSTSPFSEGGGRDTDQEWLHQFTLELVALSSMDQPEPLETEDGEQLGGGTGPGALTQD